jgi:hypothetical protein
MILSYEVKATEKERLSREYKVRKENLGTRLT